MANKHKKIWKVIFQKSEFQETNMASKVNTIFTNLNDAVLFLGLLRHRLKIGGPISLIKKRIKKLKDKIVPKNC